MLRFYQGVVWRNTWQPAETPGTGVEVLTGGFLSPFGTASPAVPPLFPMLCATLTSCRL